MTLVDPRQRLDQWLEEADGLLSAGNREETAADEDTLGPRHVGRRRARLVLERDLELHIGRSMVLGEEYVAIGLWQPSSQRYRDRVRLPSHQLGNLIDQLSELRRFLDGAR